MNSDARDNVNLWRDAGHAHGFLAERHRIPHFAEAYAALREFVPSDATRVLDLGTGDGITLAAVLDAAPAASGVGVDFSDAMIAAAGERFAGDARVELVVHDLARPLPESLGRFDLVVSSFAIHHLDDERKADLFGEVCARLESGGRFLNLEHVTSPTANLHEAFKVAMSPRGADDPSNRCASVPDQLEWLRAAGFVDVDCSWKWRELALLHGDRA